MSEMREGQQPDAVGLESSEGVVEKKDGEEEREAEEAEEESQQPELTAEERLTARLQADESITELDFSSQGLTMAPSSLFAKTHITVLNLSSNNIRGLPAEVCKLVNLRSLDLSRNGLRCAHPKDFTSLPRELEAIATLTELSLSECSLMHVPPAVWTVASLERLDISRNKIGSLPVDVMKLERLMHLNCTQTGLRTLPEEIVCCDRLQSLLLFGNPLESLPDSLRDLLQLQRLHINCRVFAARVDTDTASMIQRQQLQSEHIPSVLYHLPQLQDLDLEGCKLNQLPNSLTRSLQELNIADNLFTGFPEAVCGLRLLTHLDVSSNDFKELPAALAELRCLRSLQARNNGIADVTAVCELLQLQSLDLSDNQVKQLPPSIGRLHQLQLLLLPRNKIEKIPLALCQLSQLHTLDFTGNFIRQIPQQMQQMQSLQTAHQFNGLFKRGLWLHRNPIDDPPPRIWNTWDPAKIWDYMRRMEIQTVPQSRVCKLTLLGNHQCGKSSLINAIRLGHEKLTRSVTDLTSCYSTSHWESSNKCRFVLQEAGGHDMFRALQPKLLDPRGINCVVFDASEYQRNGFESIRRWLLLLSCHVPGAAVQLIGTKLDLCCADPQLDEDADDDNEEAVSVENLTACLQEDLEKFAQSWETDTERHFPPDSAARRQLQIFPEIHFVSARGSLPGVQRLRDSLELATMRADVALQLQKYVPANWDAFAEAMKRLPGLYLHWDDLEQLAETKNIRGNQLQDCVQYLADACRVLWLPHHPRLHKIVLHKPQRLQQFLSRLLPLNLEQFLDYDNSLFKCCGQLTEEQFADAKEAAVSSGQLSWPIVRCLAFGIGGDTRCLIESLHCIEFLELGCCTMPPSIPVAGQLHLRPVLTIAQLVQRRDDDAEEVEAAWNELAGSSQHKKQLQLQFPHCEPPALLNAFSSCFHAICQCRIDWAGSFYCEVDHCHVLLTETEVDDQLMYSVRVQLASVSDVKLQLMLQWCRDFVHQQMQFAPGMLCHVAEL